MFLLEVGAKFGSDDFCFFFIFVFVLNFIGCLIVVVVDREHKVILYKKNICSVTLLNRQWSSSFSVREATQAPEDQWTL